MSGMNASQSRLMPTAEYWRINQPNYQFQKLRSDWLILLLVVAGGFFHSNYNVIGVVLSFATLVAGCFKEGLFIGKKQALIFFLFSCCYLVQLTLPSENLAYYATSGLLFIVAANSFTGMQGKSRLPFFAAVSLFFLLDVAIYLDPSHGETLFKNPNAAAAVAISFFCCCVGLAQPPKIIDIAVCVTLLAIAALATESRGIVLFAAFTVGTYVVSIYFGRLTVIVTIVVAAMFYLWVSGEPVFMNAIDAATNGKTIELFGRDLLAFRERDVLMQYVVTALGFTWTGIGLGQSNTLLQPFGFDMSPHNTFLRLYADGGVLLLLCSIFALTLLFASIKQPILLALMAGIIVRTCFESALPFGLSSQSLLLLLPYLMSDQGRSFYRQHWVTLKKPTRPPMRMPPPGTRA
jgi:hypothetical protein